MHTLIADLFKALGDPHRVTIMERLAKGETCGCTLIDQLPISQPTLSYHLKILHEAGLTNVTKEGTWKHYQVNYEKIEALKTFLDHLKTLEGMDEFHE